MMELSAHTVYPLIFGGFFIALGLGLLFDRLRKPVVSQEMCELCQKTHKAKSDAVHAAIAQLQAEFHDWRTQDRLTHEAIFRALNELPQRVFHELNGKKNE